jgi:hypothetical protein
MKLPVSNCLIYLAFYIVANAYNLNRENTKNSHLTLFFFQPLLLLHVHTPWP